MQDTTQAARPRPNLTVTDAVALVVGMVVGVGIFRTPSLVAANASSEMVFLALWLAGGAVSLIGALCYAELASSYPDAGGEYHFLDRAFGPATGFLFAWARMAVIQTGALAAVAFVLGDHAAGIRIPIEAGEITARYFEADPVASCKHVGSRDEIDRYSVDLSRRQHFRFLETASIACAQDPIGEEHGATVRINVHKFAGKVRINSRRTHVKDQGYRPGHLEVALKHRARVAQHVRPVLKFLLIARTGVSCDG